MVWALKNLPGTEELLAYEASLNPYVIRDGKIIKNPDYVEPYELLSGFTDFVSKPLQS